MNGKKIKCHHSCRFDDEDFRFFTLKQKKTLRNEHKNANTNSRRNQAEQPNDWKKELKQEGNRIVQSLMSQLKDSVAGSISKITQQNAAPPGLPSSIMGGRDSQNQSNGNCSGRTK